jgi:hypothetical protein
MATLGRIMTKTDPDPMQTYARANEMAQYAQNATSNAPKRIDVQ